MSGLVSLEELQTTFGNQGGNFDLNLDTESIIECLKRVDFNHTGLVTNSTFLAATLSEEQLNKENLQKTYKFLNENGDGLDATDVEACFTAQGKNFSQEDVRRFFEEAGCDPDEKMSFTQFKLILLEGTSQGADVGAKGGTNEFYPYSSESN